jgi:hypothetical protein
MTDADRQHLRTLMVLVALAVAAALVAVGAGLILLIADVAAGSNEEAALGFIAAISGLTTAALSIAALVYAQIRNLWQFAPTWFRAAAWVLIVVGIVITVWNQVSS